MTAPRDGTSQAARILPELDPDYARVDERTTQDLLAFARSYARELKYFPLDDPETPRGDWSGFVADGAAQSRPHFALFLAFLELLGQARQQLNTITRRHLEFFYRDVLKMVRKRAVPDKVHVLVDVEGGADRVRVPAGTALRAGKDSLGRDLVYRTDRELVANQVQLGQVSSLYAEVKFTGVRQAREQRLKDGTKEDAFVAMLRIALGDPNPGDPLPVPIYPGVPAANAPVTFQALEQARKLLGVVESGLGMPLFDDFRNLMRLKQLRQDNDAKDWARINSLLATAGRRRDPAFQFNPQNPADFQTNLRTVLGMTPESFARLYDGLPEVKSLEEAYAVYAKRPDVREFIQRKLYLTLNEFIALMQVKMPMDNQWGEINRLLEQAGKRKRDDPQFELPEAARALRNVEQKLAAAGLDFTCPPDFQFTGGLDAYFGAFEAVERYFFMSAENFEYIMSVATRQVASGADEWDWDKVYEIVTAAHREMIYARRRGVLKAVAQDQARNLAKMLAVVLGEKPEDLTLEQALKRLPALGVSAADIDYLKRISENREPAPDWKRVYKALEIAQRNREDFADPVPQKVEWRNLYPAADARKVLVQSTESEAAALPRWKTFGAGEQKREKEPAPPPLFGWALTSPLLALGEGDRTVTLTLGFSSTAEGFDPDKVRKLLAPPDGAASTATFNPFQLEVSTAKGWLAPASVSVANLGSYPAVQGADTSKLRALVFSFALAKGQPALMPLTREVHGIDTSAPVLRLMMRPVWNEQDKCYVTSYQVLRRLLLIRARLAVTVAGLASLSIRNDEAVLDPKKPFEPFGSGPAAGSRLYLGHPEIVGKKLDWLRFNITWMGVPSKLADHYKNYTATLTNASFKARVALSEFGVLRDFSGALVLFDATDAANPVAATLIPPADQGNPDSALTASADVSQWSRHVVWELNSPDFQHSVYPSVALQKSLEMAAAVSNATTTTAPASAAATTTSTRQAVSAGSYQVNPPYTPRIKSLILDYSASAELALDAAAPAAGAVRVFHVQPFGYAELKPEGAQPGRPFLPQYDFQGELYIGLRNVAAPQNVSLLFQMAEGSANPDVTPQPVQWSYLSGNRWLTLHEGSLLAEGTRGLINSGIVELSLKPALPSTLLPPELYWIRAAIARAADCVCDLVEIHPNAVRATFADNNNAADHLSAPLAPERITGPAAPIAGIARIRQPYTSFGGKMAEQDTSFYVRVSERLRHKQRALTAWDYERLVLEKFPQLYKVKCLRADPVAHPRDPGRVELVVIPDIRNRLPFNPFEPKAPADLIRDIEAFLSDKTPPFAGVKVKNAHYVPVKVRCGVRFVPGADEGYCRRRLNEELNRFLSPWAYEEGADLVIGGSVYANSIIDFIEGRDYVDYIAEFKLFTSDDGGETFNLIPEEEGYHASAKRPDGVLVAAREHQFDVISEAEYRVAEFTGINYMRIELDFIVA